MVEVNSKLYDKLWEIADNLHPTHSFTRYGSVAEPIVARRLHCSGTKGEPVRRKSCYAFLAGTESVTEQCRRYAEPQHLLQHRSCAGAVCTGSKSNILLEDL